MPHSLGEWVMSIFKLVGASIARTVETAAAKRVKSVSCIVGSCQVLDGRGQELNGRDVSIGNKHG